MKFVRDLGVGQCVLPPLARPNLEFLRQIGFSGTDAELIDRAYRTNPVLLAVCYSASNMWTANAATVSPSMDCRDGRLHFTPANLTSNLHRSIEAIETQKMLQSIFFDHELFCVHNPLPTAAANSDEGAANHTRLTASWDDPGLELFVYGVEFLNSNSAKPIKFPARQTLEASRAVARRHQLDPVRCLFLQQNPVAIDAGVFHNDVISVGHQNVLLCHELAFCHQAQSIAELTKKYAGCFKDELHIVSFSESELPLADAVSSYLFNSQIVTRSDGAMVLICPAECESNVAARHCTEKIVQSENPIEAVHFLDLRQSMNNGGGPACLRLRVVLDERQQQSFHQNVRLTDALYDQLVGWVNQHYREELSPDDLRDPNLIEENRAALRDLGTLLKSEI